MRCGRLSGAGIQAPEEAVFFVLCNGIESDTKIENKDKRIT
jgi:hypothetical protein